ncbi:hypothetical protein [Streptomyces sp. NPDC052225]|uniref:hypothetical protein n=1 Tax=Streptomyces sp. NPDC052225 TaxID=3154949 RepID=UPI0034218D96
MRRATRFPRRSVGTTLALVGTLLLPGLTSCSSPQPTAQASSRSAAPAPPTTVTRAMPSDIAAVLLPSTGPQTRWAQGLDTFGTLAAKAATRSCADSHGVTMPQTMPGMFFRIMEIPDLPFIRLHGFDGGFAPGESSTAAPAAAPASPSPAQQRCTREGMKAGRELKDIYVPLQSKWWTRTASLRRDPRVEAAFRHFGACLSDHDVPAKDENAFFALADRRMQAGDTAGAQHLGNVYATCMTPVEAVREPLRKKLNAQFRAAHASELKRLNTALPAKIHELEKRYGIQISFPAP